jgi:hypothetical protein
MIRNGILKQKSASSTRQPCRVSLSPLIQKFPLEAQHQPLTRQPSYDSQIQPDADVGPMGAQSTYQRKHFAGFVRLGYHVLDGGRFRCLLGYRPSSHQSGSLGSRSATDVSYLLGRRHPPCQFHSFPQAHILILLAKRRRDYHCHL